MIGTKLILVEGIIGSGKTTTAENLAKEINQSGKKAVWYHENDPNHPLNTFFSRILQENYGEKFDLEPVIRKIRRNDRSVDTLPLWRALAESSMGGDNITIIESRFWQHETMYWFMLNFDLKKVMRRQQEITQILSASQPFLAYLANDGVAPVIENAFRTRPVEWQQWVLWLFGEHPYFKARNLTGINGLITFFEAWNQVACELYECYPYSKVMLCNPHKDWQAATQALHQALELEQGAAALTS